MRQLIIVDNQDITKAGLLYYTRLMKEIKKITAVGSKKELIAQLCYNQDAVVVIDYTLSDFGSAGELLIVQERFKKSDWILFSETLNDDFLKQVLYANQSFSVVLKSDTENEITTALCCAEHHERYICNRVSNQLLESRKTVANRQENILTATETLILKEIALGKTTKEIALERNLSFHTVITHRKNIFRKLDVNNRHEATKYAMRAGIVDPSEYYI